MVTATLPVEVIYGGFLSLSLLLACLMRRLPGRTERQAFGCVIGIITLVIIVHNITLLVFLLTSMIVLAITPKDWLPLGLLVYSFTFLYPTRAFRKGDDSGSSSSLPSDTVDGVSNACLLIMSLRNSMFGRDQFQTFQGSIRDYYDYISYMVFFPGLLTGPVYNVKDWIQALEDDNHDIDLSEIKNRLYRAIVWAVIFITCAEYFPIEFMLTDDFAVYPLVLRCIYITLSTYYFFGGRCFAGWYVAEAGLAAIGLRARNTDFWAPEKANTVSQYIREWNKSVQTFFAIYVYRPLRVMTPIKPVRAAIVMCCSAYWHGLEAGLYVFFLSIFLESAFLNNFPRLPSPFGYIHVTFLLSYYGAAFMLKNDLSKALTVWSNMGYVGHWYTGIRFLLWLAWGTSRRLVKSHNK